MYLDPHSGKRVLQIARVAGDKFTEGKWLELGLLTNSHDIVTGHSRLLRSLSWGDPDYPDNVLAVLTQIVARDEANLGIIENYLSGEMEPEGENISTEKSKGRLITFCPAVFDVPEEGVDPKLIAVMMPFDGFSPVYEAITGACQIAGLRAQRADDIWDHQTIIQDVFSLIFRSRAVVCDYTGRNPNVFYEAGIAHTLGKTVIPITQHPSDVPFDVSHHRYIRYLNNSEGLATMKKQLIRKLQSLRS